MRFKLSISFLFIFFILAGQALATFQMSLSSGFSSIDFGAMQRGEEKTLSERGGYEHQFNFTSDNARTWYFKAQLIRPLTNGMYTIPAESLEWVVEEVIGGRGIDATNISSPSPFYAGPVLIYTSADTDNSGTQVNIRLKYRLTIPEKQAAGTYTAHIRFMMIEEL